LENRDHSYTGNWPHGGGVRKRNFFRKENVKKIEKRKQITTKIDEGRWGFRREKQEESCDGNV